MHSVYWMYQQWIFPIRLTHMLEPIICALFSPFLKSRYLDGFHLGKWIYLLLTCIIHYALSLIWCNQILNCITQTLWRLEKNQWILKFGFTLNIDKVNAWGHLKRQEEQEVVFLRLACFLVFYLFISHSSIHIIS